MKFPEKFYWGTATASFQFEGAVEEDGRGKTIWDDFTRKPHAIYGGHIADVASDFYHKYPEDIRLMRELGLNAFRFSVGWTRVFPEGTGKVNRAGLDFYSRMIDNLLENGIEPFMTLFHWDYPTALEYRGGWLNPDSPKWYADYADTVIRALGDRVKKVMTFNEPMCFINSGYGDAMDAPGLRRSMKELLVMWHNVLIAHGMGVQAVRGAAPETQIGYAPTSTVAMPVENSAEAIETARKAYFSVSKDAPLWSCAMWSDPIMLGKYPEELTMYFDDIKPDIRPDDIKTIHQKLDFYAQNIYNGYYVKSDGNGGWSRLPREDGHARSLCDWPVTPECLYWGPKFLYERYGLPVYLTENGISCHDWVMLDGKVHDPNRQDMLERYLQQLGRAIGDGTDVRGYFVWTFLDDFEWRTGYSDRFGLVHVDFDTLKRIPKDSAYWYGNVARSNGGIIR